ncbi:MAG: hypothetical protein WCI22_08475 [Actinomycetota bacterium]
MAESRITRDDLENKFRAVQTDLQGKVEDRKKNIMSAAVIGGIVIVVIFYLLGRRAGKSTSTFVEIRRV